MRLHGLGLDVGEALHLAGALVVGGGDGHGGWGGLAGLHRWGGLILKLIIYMGVRDGTCGGFEIAATRIARGGCSGPG